MTTVPWSIIGGLRGEKASPSETSSWGVDHEEKKTMARRGKRGGKTRGYKDQKPRVLLDPEEVKYCNCGTPETWKLYNKQDGVCHSPDCAVFFKNHIE